MSVFLQNTSVFEDCEIDLENWRATSRCLSLRSSIVEPLMKSVQSPSTQEQLFCLLLIKSKEQTVPKSDSVIIPRSEEGWRKVSDVEIWFHSKWAANYARYLELFKSEKQIKDWFYQPKAFRIRGQRGMYTPDFQVIRLDGSHFWVEIKDVEQDDKLWEKTFYFMLQHSQESLIFVDHAWFKENLVLLRTAMSDWEISC